MHILHHGNAISPKETFGSDTEVLQDEPVAQFVLVVCQARRIYCETPYQVPSIHCAASRCRWRLLECHCGTMHLRVHVSSRILVWHHSRPTELNCVALHVRVHGLTVMAHIHDGRLTSADVPWRLLRRWVRCCRRTADADCWTAGGRSHDICLSIRTFRPQIDLKDKEGRIRCEVVHVNFAAGLIINHDQTDAGWRGDGPSVLVSKPAHSGALRLLDDFERVSEPISDHACRHFLLLWRLGFARSRGWR